MTVEDKFTEMIMEPETKTCSRCGREMKFKGNGLYKCQKCGNEYTNYYGIVREYTRRNGLHNAQELSKATGVPLSEILRLIKEGHLQRI